MQFLVQTIGEEIADGGKTLADGLGSANVPIESHCVFCGPSTRRPRYSRSRTSGCRLGRFGGIKRRLKANVMFDCPEASHTSPTNTSLTAIRGFLAADRHLRRESRWPSADRALFAIGRLASGCGDSIWPAKETDTARGRRFPKRGTGNSAARPYGLETADWERRRPQQVCRKPTGPRSTGQRSPE